MPDTGHSLEEGDFPGIGSGVLLGILPFDPCYGVIGDLAT